MAITMNIKKFCEERGVQYGGVDVTSGYKLRIVCDLNSPTTANQLWNGEMGKIGMGTIEQICRGLGCEPNDLFHFDPPLSHTKARVTHTKPAKPKGKKPKAQKVEKPEQPRLRLIS